MIQCEKYKNVQPLDDFDWSVYDGWNGKSLTVNKKVKTDNGIKLYSHEKYAKSALKLYCGGSNVGYEDIKDLREGGIIRIKDAQLVGKDDLLLSTTTGGSAIVKLSKETKFFELFNITKEQFKKEVINSPKEKKKFLDGGYFAKVGRNGVASLYDGLLIRTENDFHRQISLGRNADTAYTGKIIGSNSGGYIMDINGVKCFLPGGQAASNKLTDFESLVGKEMEVMIMKYIEGSGFLVSRKKYLEKVRPAAIAELRKEVEKDPERIYSGVVTGASHFGIFIEMNEYYTGLLHKTYVTEETLEKLTPNPEETDLNANARRNFKPGEIFQVKIYKITDDDKIVFTNIMDKTQREEIVSAREKAEAEAAAKAEADAKAAKEAAEELKLKKSMANQDRKFKNTVVSLEDLKK